MQPKAAQQEKGQGSADQRKHAETRPADEMKFEVAQRGSAIKDAHKTPADRMTHPDSPQGAKTGGYGKRDDRENPKTGLGQDGQSQSHELPGQGTRVGNDEVKDASKTTNARAMSQNGARISDFESR